MARVPTHDELLTAHAFVRGRVRRTPLLDAPSLALATGAARVWVKAESLQLAGSFKIRGATWRIAQLSPEERARGVVAFSSGNFAQGLAAAGQAAGVPVTIVMPADAPEVKRRATEGFGARVVLSDHGDRPREEVAAERAAAMARDEGLTLLHPFDDPAVVAGHAGVAIEALEQLADLEEAPDLVLCPTGGGGLVAGVALAMRATHPGAVIVAVEPEGSNGMGLSLAAAGRVAAPGAPTLCDALMARQPGAAPFAAAGAAGIGAASVTDADTRAALSHAFERLKIVLEPSGAAGIAALLGGRVSAEGRRVLIVASGGNIGLQTFIDILAG